MEPKLKPCPCCGGKPYFRGGITGATMRQIRCENCGMSTPYDYNIENLAEIWNRRANNG